jgi:hypothetical protein
MTKLHRVLIWTLILVWPILGASSVLAQVPEIATPSSDSASLTLDELGTELDLSLGYHHFTDEDMDGTYSYLPMVGAGVSFLVAPQVRTFVGFRYGKKSGDPYHDLPGFENGPDITVKSLPILIGMKVNLASSSRIRLHVGGAMMFAYTREEGIPQLGSANTLDSSPATDILTGFQLTFAPEWILGQGRRSMGVELAYGGTRGTLKGDTHSHDIDLFGFSGRVFYAFKLGGK